MEKKKNAYVRKSRAQWLQESSEQPPPTLKRREKNDGSWLGIVKIFVTEEFH